jgi:hypothetical protein
MNLVDLFQNIDNFDKIRLQKSKAAITNDEEKSILSLIQAICQMATGIIYEDYQTLGLELYRIQDVSCKYNGFSLQGFGYSKIAMLGPSNKLWTIELVDQESLDHRNRVYNEIYGIKNVFIPKNRYSTINKGYKLYITNGEFCKDVNKKFEENSYLTDNDLKKLRDALNAMHLKKVYPIDIKPDNMLKCGDNVSYSDLDDALILYTNRNPKTAGPYDMTFFIMENTGFDISWDECISSYTDWVAWALVCMMMKIKTYLGYIREKKLVDQLRTYLDKRKVIRKRKITAYLKEFETKTVFDQSKELLNPFLLILKKYQKEEKFEDGEKKLIIDHIEKLVNKYDGQSSKVRRKSSYRLKF